jgi:hypothetical protein
MNRIQTVEVLENHRLKVLFEDGSSGVVDLGADIEAGGVFAALRGPHVFGEYSLEHGGRILGWPCGVDLCADALWLEIHGKDTSAA